MTLLMQEAHATSCICLPFSIRVLLFIHPNNPFLLQHTKRLKQTILRSLPSTPAVCLPANLGNLLPNTFHGPRVTRTPEGVPHPVTQ